MDSTAVAQILGAAAEIEDGWQLGLRVIGDQDPAAVGDELGPSPVWIDGTATDEMLPGTSCLAIRSAGMMDSPVTSESLARALELAKQYVGNRIVLVAGEDAGYGEDEGEVVIAEAEVMLVVGR